MKAIIIASGKGPNLGPNTEDRPPCMIEIHGRPLVQHQLKMLEEQGVDDVTVIGGYKYRSIDAQGARLVVDRDFESNTNLMSFFAAGPELVGDVVICQGNVVFAPQILENLLNTPTAGCLVIDRQWRAMHQKHNAVGTDHDLELCEVAESGFVRHVGRRVTSERASGEFIGLLRLNAPLMTRLWSIYMAALARGIEAPFGDSQNLREAHFSDLLNEAFRAGELFNVVAVDGGWRALNAVEDLEKVRSKPLWN